MAALLARMPALEPAGLHADLERIVGLGTRFCGTAGERRCEELLLEEFTAADLASVRAEQFQYLAYEPVSASCTVVGEHAAFACVGIQSTADGEAEGAAVFVGEGTADELDVLARRGSDVRGKIAVIANEVPARVVPELLVREPAAIVNIGPTPDGLIGHFTAMLYPPPLEPPWPGSVVPVPGVTVEAQAGRRLLSLLSTGPLRLRVEHRAAYVEKTTANVVGEIPGREAPEQRVVVGAHYDSQLSSPGACDNATGLSVLLALARGWSGLELRRTVVLCAFAGEELGCWGSTAYVAAHADETAVAMVNFDALGVPFPATRTALCDPVLVNLATASARSSGWDVEATLDARLFPYADTAPFVDAGVPACWMWRYPPNHPYYHSAGDTLRWVDIQRLAEDGTAGAAVAFRLAHRSDRELPGARRS